MQLRVALVDDHRLFRDGLRALLALQPDLQVVGEAADAREAYAMVASAKPDVVLLDVTLPGIDGIAATRELLRRESRCRVLMLTMPTDEDYCVEAPAAGASGYALKDEPAAAIVAAIRRVGQGEAYVSPQFSRALLDQPRRRAANNAAPSGPL